jgi:hypothetical protein
MHVPEHFKKFENHAFLIVSENFQAPLSEARGAVLCAC